MSDTPERKGQQILMGFEATRLSPKLVRFCELIALGFNPETEEPITQTEAARLAGIGNTEDSSRTLAARYMQDLRVKAMIERLESERWGNHVLRQSDVIAGAKELLDKCLGRMPVSSTVFKKNGSTREVLVRKFNPKEAAKVIELMATMTGMLQPESEDKSVTRSSGDRVPAQERELSDIERSARLVDILRRVQPSGAGQDHSKSVV